MKLYLSEGSPGALKVLAAAKATDALVELQWLPQDAHVVPFLIRPQVPALWLGKETFLFSANTICQYFFRLSGKVCDLGQEHNDSANQLFEWEATELEPALSTAMYLFVVQGKRGEEVLEVMRKPLNYIDLTLTKKGTHYLTGLHSSNTIKVKFGTAESMVLPEVQ